ncbi:hypothetical protein [Clostridium cylindrosporum]|uniref:DUF3021 family protein n=1 Tax=Clostridium cylindrosporum DSM 605 TaxID=1121307 RepID=A0A0J8D8J7_CLOCY|nr:hypothetical protein [Clostridium cylindrosporum]KMT22380.1 hypothetical protein CLCY_13c00150 [Clostridium cylindrosporum DSM 605]
MAKLKYHFIINCISFTFITLSISIIQSLNLIESIKVINIYQIFLMTTLVQVLMFFTNKLHITSTFLLIVVNLFNIFIVVFPLGYYFNLFDLSLSSVLIVTFLNVTSFFLIYLGSMIKNQCDASLINLKIEEMKNKSK